MAQQLRRGRGRVLIIAIAVLILIAIILSAATGFYVDLLWFREVHFGSVFWKVIWSKVLLGTVAGLVFFGLLLSNLIIARRLTPRFRPFSPEQEMIERYRSAFEPYAKYVLPLFSAVIAIFVGLAASAQWQTFLLWRSAGNVAFGAKFADKVFHRDPAFYIFHLPFLKFVQGWLFSALVGITVIVAISHYLTGGIRFQTAGEKVTPQVKAHLSVLLGLIVLVKAWGYYLGKFDLLYSSRGFVSGASYTDIHAQLPALKLLVFIAIACGIFFFVNIRLRGWIFPVLAIGLLALVSIVAGAIVPAIVQKFRVSPQELQKEQPFIQRNIDATRFAFGVQIEPGAASPTPDVSAQQVADNTPTVTNIRLWNPGVLQSTYEALQRIQPYYEFSDVDVDRYLIGGQERVIMISAREVSQSGIPGSPGWQPSHLIYTHGFGAAASLVNTSTSSGAPAFVLQDIPPVGSGIKLSPQKGSQVYYGELHDVPYVITDTKQPELDFPNPNGPGSKTTTYQGSGGIPVNGFFRRLVFAYRYKDFNLLISGLIDRNSRILINRDIRTRITKAAPFLTYDRDPYVAIVGGRLKYILDGYTTTDLYPYSERADLSSTTNGDLSGRINYIRNSVKAVVDAYDGTLKLYVVDPSDPLIRVWEQAFPKLFTPASQASQELVAHFRYPEDLFQVQVAQFARYHVTDAPTFFSNDKRWAVPDALPQAVNGEAAGTLRPYYVVTKLPGTDQEQFVLFEPLTPFGRQNMVGYLAAGSDPGQYGKLTAFQFPTGENVFGPTQIRNLINQDTTVSSQITLLSQKGSEVQFGDLIVVPVQGSFLYVQPIFVRASGVNPIPELKRVVVVHGGSATIANSLDDALAGSFGQQVTPPPSGGGAPTPTGGGKVAQLLAQALQHFQAAQQALTKGDLAGYQREISLAQQLVQQAQQAAASPSPSASPSSSP